MKSFALTIVAAAFALCSFGWAGQGVFKTKDDEPKTELEGTWDLVAIEADGKELKLPKDGRMITTGNKFVLKAGDKTIIAGTFKLDPKKKPKAIDVTYTEGPDKGKSFKGIYEVDGDTVRFCRPLEPDGERPTEFKTKPGTGAATYKRAKK
jgi:uncharacterized protein (TIGR03067 family)